MPPVPEVTMQLLQDTAYQIRRLSVEMITYGTWGHIGGSFSMAELLAVLYFQHMRIDPARPDWPDRDRLVLSKAHGSPALYAALALRGYYPVEKLYTYCELNGIEGHTDMRRTPGLEASGGPLGMGLSVAVGLPWACAIAKTPSRGRSASSVTANVTKVTCGKRPCPPRTTIWTT